MNTAHGVTQTNPPLENQLAKLGEGLSEETSFFQNAAAAALHRLNMNLLVFQPQVSVLASKTKQNYDFSQVNVDGKPRQVKMLVLADFEFLLDTNLTVLFMVIMFQ